MTVFYIRTSLAAAGFHVGCCGPGFCVCACVAPRRTTHPDTLTHISTGIVCCICASGRMCWWCIITVFGACVYVCGSVLLCGLVYGLRRLWQHWGQRGDIVRARSWSVGVGRRRSSRQLLVCVGHAGHGPCCCCSI